MRFRHRKLAAVLIAVIALSAVFAMGTWAYFSDYEIAHGEVTLDLSWKTEIEEKVYDGNKDISIKNTGATSVVVRVAIFTDELMTITAPDDWEEYKDENHDYPYYYYTKVLAPGESTSTIKAELKDLTEEQKASIGDTFDVVVAHESALAVCDEDQKVIKPEGWDYLPNITLE